MSQARVRIPQQKRSIETRNRLLAAAKRLFSEKGFHRTNAKQIAEAAGVSVGSFYAYFPDKKALFIEIFCQHIEGHVIDAMTRSTEGDFVPRQAVGRIIDEVLAAHDMSPAFHREAMAMRYSDPDVDRLMAEAKKKSLAHLRQLLEAFRDRLRIDDLDAAALLIVEVVEAVIHSVKIFGSPVGTRRLLGQLTDMLLRYLFETPEDCCAPVKASSD